MNRQELVEFTDGLADDLVPMAPDAADVCPVCRAGKAPSWETCSSCERTLAQVAHPCRTIIPVSYYTKPEADEPASPFRDAMHGYKDAETAQDRLDFSLVVGGVLVRYLVEQGDALAQHFGEWDEVVTIPSTRTPPPSALARVLADSFSEHIQSPVEWLKPGPGEMRWVQASEDGFVTTVDVEGVRVLLIDDTFTTGARMQSAAHALQAAGATVVCGMTVSRKIRVNDTYRTVDLWARQSSTRFSFTASPWWKHPPS